ncbi:MAG: AAA family ATPase [Desulfobacterales bacterium]|nr:AAA family ATPase [Desulfobacterales bacterium]
MMNKLVLDFFGFSHMPFSKTFNPKNAFGTKSYEEAIAQLQYGIKDEDVMMISGPVGSGKSVVLRSLIESLDNNSYIPIYIRGTSLRENDLYKSILLGLNITPPHFPGKAKRLFFSHVPELSKIPLIIIDDAQEMTDSAIVCIKTMTNFEFDSKSYVSFILSGQPELRSRLRLTQFLALTQRIRIFFHLKPMSLQETCGYIDHHLKIAGRSYSIFADSAKTDIHKWAEGIPRKVNVICYRSLVSAALNELSIIDSSNLLIDEPTDDT